MEALIIIGLVVWFIIGIPRANARVKHNEAMEAHWRKEDQAYSAMLADLRCRRDAGDEQAASMLRWYGAK